MINVLIAFDNLDNNLGDYFEQSKSQSSEVIAEVIQDYNCLEVPSTRCNVAYLDLILPQFNQSPFIFVNYSHGTSTTITCSNSIYISNDNVYLFSNAFAYIMSCEVAAELGPHFIANHALAFIGFNKETYALRGSYQNLSITCDNYALLLFLNGNILRDAFAAMKANYTIKADHLEEMGEPLKAADLLECRDSLVFLGNGNLTIKDFILN
jgi:hypothetical protein